MQPPTLDGKVAGLLSGPTGRMLRLYTSFSSAAMPEGVRMAAARAPPVEPVSGVAEAQACGGKGQGQQALKLQQRRGSLKDHVCWPGQ